MGRGPGGRGVSVGPRAEGLPLPLPWALGWFSGVTRMEVTPPPVHAACFPPPLLVGGLGVVLRHGRVAAPGVAAGWGSILPAVPVISSVPVGRWGRRFPAVWWSHRPCRSPLLPWGGGPTHSLGRGPLYPGGGVREGYRHMIFIFPSRSLTSPPTKPRPHWGGHPVRPGAVDQ